MLCISFKCKTLTTFQNMPHCVLNTFNHSGLGDIWQICDTDRSLSLLLTWNHCWYFYLTSCITSVYQSLALTGSDNLLQCMNHLTHNILKQCRLYTHTYTNKYYTEFNFKYIQLELYH